MNDFNTQRTPFEFRTPPKGDKKISISISGIDRRLAIAMDKGFEVIKTKYQRKGGRKISDNEILRQMVRHCLEEMGIEI